MKAHDFMNKEINVGDTVVFPHSGAQKLVSGTVLSISAKQCRIRCTRGHSLKGMNFHSGERTTTPDITQRNHNHCVVIKDENEN